MAYYCLARVVFYMQTAPTIAAIWLKWLDANSANILSYKVIQNIDQFTIRINTVFLNKNITTRTLTKLVKN